MALGKLALLVTFAYLSVMGCRGDSTPARDPLAGLQPTGMWSQWQQAGCTAGVGASCSELADAFRRGRDGLTRDDARAAALVRRACELGYQPSCARVAKH